MSHFYQATYFTSQGIAESRDFFLPSVSMVRKEILAAGGTVVAIREKTHKLWQREWYSRDYKIQFLRSIALQARSGKSPGQALATVIVNERNPRKRIELDLALQMIEKQGRDFSDAISHLGIFDKTVITILRAGERFGLRAAVEATAAYLVERKAGIAQLVGGLGWVALEFITSLSSTIEVQFHVLPWLEKQGREAKDRPDAEQFARDIAAAYFVNGLFLWSAVAIIAAIVGAVVAYQTHLPSRTRIDRWLARTPVLNRFLVDSVMGRSFQIASIMLSSRVTFYEVATILSEVSAVTMVRGYWRNVIQALRSTSSTSDALSAGGMLHKEEQQLLRHHEDSLQLAESFALLAENRAESFRKGRKLFISLGFAAMVVYSLVSIGVVLFIYAIYSSTLNAALLEHAGGAL